MAASSTQAGAAKKRPAESVDEDIPITDAPSVSKKRKPRYLPYEHILGTIAGAYFDQTPDGEPLRKKASFRPGCFWWA